MIEVIQAADGEPLSTEEVIAFLGESDDVSEQLSLITIFIAAARQAAEHELQRYLLTQTLALHVDRFPCDYLRRQYDRMAAYEILLPPLTAISAIEYVDTAGVMQTLAADQYIVDAVSRPARVAPAYATTWPATRRQPNAVKITFDAGYGDAAAVPACVKHWMLLGIKAAYDSRDRFVPGVTSIGALLPEWVNGLLDPERVHGWR